MVPLETNPPHICRGPIDDHRLIHIKPSEQGLLDIHSTLVLLAKPAYGHMTHDNPLFVPRFRCTATLPSQPSPSSSAVNPPRHRTLSPSDRARVIVLQQQKTAVFHLEHCCKQIYVAVGCTSVLLPVASYHSPAFYKMLCLGSPDEFHDGALHHVPTG